MTNCFSIKTIINLTMNSHRLLMIPIVSPHQTNLITTTTKPLFLIKGIHQQSKTKCLWCRVEMNLMMTFWWRNMKMPLIKIQIQWRENLQLWLKMKFKTQAMHNLLISWVVEVLTLPITKVLAVRKARIPVVVMHECMTEQVSSLHQDFLLVWGCQTRISRAILLILTRRRVQHRMAKMGRAFKQISNNSCSSKCNSKICISIKLDQMEIQMGHQLVEDLWMFTRMLRTWDRKAITIPNQ